jgi:hypothetical protein
MAREVDPNRIEVVDRRVAEILRSKTTAERLAMAFAANRFARRVLAGSILTKRPDLTASELQTMVARRMLDDGTRAAT